jgi:hypothetical protein
MQRYKILHRTYYTFSAVVLIQPHTLRWHRDAEDNSLAIATFDSPASQLVIESEAIIQQFNDAPLDFLVAD